MSHYPTDDSSAEGQVDSPKKPKAVLGVAVLLGSYLFTRLLNLMITIILARILLPEGMGVVAVALLTVEVIDMLRDLGLRETLIYNRSRDVTIQTTAFVMMISIGCAQALLLLAAAPLAPLVVDDPQITAALIWLSLLFPINTLGSVQEAMLQKAFFFGRVALTEIASVLVKAGVSLGLLFGGAGIWSIVTGILCGAVVRAIALWLVSNWRPTWVRPTPAAAKYLFGYGRHIIASNMLNVLRTRADQMGIVLAIGDTALAVYFIAARIPEIVIYGVNVAVTRVVFPMFSSISDDAAELSANYRATIHGAMTLMAPVSIGLAAIAPQVVVVLFSPEWSAAGPLLTLLALNGIPLTLGWSTGDVFKATGRPNLLSRIMMIETIVIAPAVWIVAFATHDLNYVAIMLLVGEVFAMSLRLWFMQRFGGVRVADSLFAVARPLAAALLMGIAVIVFVQFPLAVGDGARLAISVGLGAAVYAVTLYLIDKRNVRVWLALLLPRRT